MGTMQRYGHKPHIAPLPYDGLMPFTVRWICGMREPARSGGLTWDSPVGLGDWPAEAYDNWLKAKACQRGRS